MLIAGADAATAGMADQLSLAETMRAAGVDGRRWSSTTARRTRSSTARTGSADAGDDAWAVY